MDRPNHGTTDYTDYAEAYDTVLRAQRRHRAAIIITSTTRAITIVPLQYITGSNHFKKLSQELRVATPADKPFRVIAGAFYQHQTNDILQEYHVDNLAADLSVNGVPGSIWLTKRASHRPRLCAVWRSELRHHAADHADRRRPLLQVQQHRLRFRRLRPQPGLHPGRGQRRYPRRTPRAAPRPASRSASRPAAIRFANSQLNGTDTTLILDGALPGTPCINVGRFRERQDRAQAEQGRRLHLPLQRDLEAARRD